MSPYPGVRGAYIHGRSEGYAWGKDDVAAGLGHTSDALRSAEQDAQTAGTRNGRAYALGYLRGYREAVRTYAHGRWGL